MIFLDACGRSSKRACVAWAVVTMFCATLRADQIVVNGVSHPGAKITGLVEGKLQYRLADGRALSAWIDDVQLMVVDRGGVFDDFNQAEQFRHEGDALRAIARYERTFRMTQDYWPELIACRLASAHDMAGQIDRTAHYMVRMIHGEHTGIGIAARLYPRSIPEKRDARVARALDLLADETRKANEDDRKVLVEVLRYEILARTDPAAAKPLARIVAELHVPAPARTERVFNVILQAMQELVRESPGSLGVGVVDRAIRDCPESALPGLLLVKGQVLSHASSSQEQLMHAAWSFLRVPIHMPDHELAPRGLYHAAVVMDRLEKQKQARSLLEECTNHRKTGPELRKQAETLAQTLDQKQKDNSSGN